jgi:hypothetical protein
MKELLNVAKHTKKQLKDIIRAGSVGEGYGFQQAIDTLVTRYGTECYLQGERNGARFGKKADGMLPRQWMENDGFLKAIKTLVRQLVHLSQHAIVKHL